MHEGNPPRLKSRSLCSLWLFLVAEVSFHLQKSTGDFTHPAPVESVGMRWHRLQGRQWLAIRSWGTGRTGARIGPRKEDCDSQFSAPSLQSETRNSLMVLWFVFLGSAISEGCWHGANEDNEGKCSQFYCVHSINVHLLYRSLWFLVAGKDGAGEAACGKHKFSGEESILVPAGHPLWPTGSDEREALWAGDINSSRFVTLNAAIWFYSGRNSSFIRMHVLFSDYIFTIWNTNFLEWLLFTFSLIF